MATTTAAAMHWWLISTMLLALLTTTSQAFTCSSSSALNPMDATAQCDSQCQNYIYNAAGSASAVPALSNTPSTTESDIDCASGNACVMLSAIYFICLDKTSWDWTDGYGGTGNIKTGQYQFKNGQSTSVSVATNTQAVMTMSAAAGNASSKSSAGGAAQVLPTDFRRETGLMGMMGFALAVVEWMIL